MRVRPRPMSAKAKLYDDMADADPGRGKREWMGGDPDYTKTRGAYLPSRPDEIALNRKKWISNPEQRLNTLRHEDGHAVWKNLSKESKKELSEWAKNENVIRILEERTGHYKPGAGELWADIWMAATTGDGWENYSGVFEPYVREAISAARKLR